MNTKRKLHNVIFVSRNQLLESRKTKAFDELRVSDFLAPTRKAALTAHMVVFLDYNGDISVIKNRFGPLNFINAQ